MNVEFITVSDLLDFKKELISEIKSYLTNNDQPSKTWLKSNEVRKILGCSHGTLQNLRINETLNPTKIGGTWYYDANQVYSLLSKAS